MATIRAIESRSVHQIQSGQVIVDLTSVVKELVENSLDAGSSSIEVRLKNHGLDYIEVQDNGKGIAPEDYETVALKHFTSKLSNFEDLDSLETFGFRGEALSSLCALSKFSVITARAEDGAVGKRLDFEVSGKLKSSSVTAAQKGTTVVVENIFHNLPVRRKELEKNIKREYNKIIALLYSYACIGVGVRFAASNQMPKGRKLSIFSTNVNSSTKDNIANVFGAKTLLALIPLDVILEMKPSKGPFSQISGNKANAESSRVVHVKGHVSKPVFGEGRQTADRQLLYVNSRPCNLPQITKLFNEVYRSFNLSQSPFVFANFKMDTDAYDVNVSPDKKSIMLHDQPALLESLKTSLTELFERSDHTMPQSQLPTRKLPSYQPLTIANRPSIGSSPTPDYDEDASDGAEHEATPEDRPVSNGSAVKNYRRPSMGLVEAWPGRNTSNRRERAANNSPHDKQGKDKQRLINALRQKSFDDDIPEAHDANDPNDDHDEKHNDPSLEYRDIHGEHSSHDNCSTSTNPESPQVLPTSTATDMASKIQPGIPAFSPGTPKIAPGPVASAFDRMRPKRTPQETAEITIGDNTITTIVGTAPASKRRRIHTSNTASSKFRSSLLPARGLGQFAAPGSQMEFDRTEGSASSPGHSLDDDDGEEEGSKGIVDSDGDGREGEDNEVDEDDEAALSEKDEREQDLEPDTDQREAALNRSASPEVLSGGISTPFYNEKDDDADEDYEDEDETAKKKREDERVAQLIEEAETTARPHLDNFRRATQILKSSATRKETTVNLNQHVSIDIDEVRKQSMLLATRTTKASSSGEQNRVIGADSDEADAERKLSLTVSKADFERMRIIGQFNLGFILAVRPAANDTEQDELFIIDQHAADEKYNYERLQRTVTLQSQRLVQPKTLDLTAVEEEIISQHADVLAANGFEVEIHHASSNEESVPYSSQDPQLDELARRVCRLTTLPTSANTTFALSDLEELLHLVSERPAGSSEIPRPKRVQRMLAMRACRSSIMVGKTLTDKMMNGVVRHMGEMEKPWNCPHGRPTMRHLASLGGWSSWLEGRGTDDGVFAGQDERMKWRAWLEARSK